MATSPFYVAWVSSVVVLVVGAITLWSIIIRNALNTSSSDAIIISSSSSSSSSSTGPSSSSSSSSSSRPDLGDAYICAGQSNMVGGVNNPSNLLNLYQSTSIQQLTLDFRITQAIEPLAQPFTNPTTGNIGPCMTFVSGMVAQTGRTSVIIPTACQSTGFTTNTNIKLDDVSGSNLPIIGNWFPKDMTNITNGPYMFYNLINRTKFVQSLGYQIKGMIWLQGEADTGTQTTGSFWGPSIGTPAESTATHTADLVSLFGSIRSNLSIPNLPIVLFQMAPPWVATISGTGATGIQASINNIPFTLANTATVWAIDPITGTSLGSTDVHYTGLPQRTLGFLGSAALDAAIHNQAGSVPGIILPSPNVPSVIQWAPDPQATLGYRVFVNHVAITTLVPQSITNPITLIKFTIPGLTSGTVYGITIQGVNAIGNGALSSSISITGASSSSISTGLVHFVPLISSYVDLFGPDATVTQLSPGCQSFVPIPNTPLSSWRSTCPTTASYITVSGVGIPVGDQSQCIWFNPITIPTPNAILFTCLNTGEAFACMQAWYVPVAPARFAYRMNPSATPMLFPIALATNAWTHVCVVYSITPSTMQLYLNGTQVDASPTITREWQGLPKGVPAIGGPSSSTLGPNGGNNGSFLYHRIYNTSTSSATIQAIYQLESPFTNYLGIT